MKNRNNDSDTKVPFCTFSLLFYIKCITKKNIVKKIETKKSPTTEVIELSKVNSLLFIPFA